MSVPTDILSQLHPVRLPDGYEMFEVNDLVASFAVGIAAALLLRLILQVFAHRPQTPVQRLRSELSALRGLDPSERLLRQARLFRTLEEGRRSDTPRKGRRPATAMHSDSSWEAELSQALYRSMGNFDLDAFDDRILRAARGRRI